MFHVLVVAGLHVGAFAAFLLLPCTEIQAFTFVTSLAVVLCVICYVAVVEQRPPVLHAALMTLAVVLALVFYRRGELLNSVAIAAMIFLFASPSSLTDSSFQLSFLSMFCFAALAAFVAGEIHRAMRQRHARMARRLAHSSGRTTSY